jgi:nitrogen fixation/metabolism regulation signal transduction histidine kinase
MQEKQSFEVQLTQLSLIASLPLFFLLIWVMVYAEISVYLILLTVLFSSISIVLCHVKIHQKSSYQFRSLSNLLDAMIRGDYSLRGRANRDDIALTELVDAINSLAIRLNKQRIESIESQLLLRTVINHIDVAIITLSAENELILLNPAANKVLQLSNEKSHTLSLKQLEQLGQLESGQSKVMTLMFAKQQGKYNVHMEEFRDAGKQQKLLFISDVSNILRSEEQNAWQSLVRVISHEINNSLAPIASISQTLKRFLSRQENIEDHKDDLIEGLTIISQRTNSLRDFVNSYKQISSLPLPKKIPTSIIDLVNKIIPLYAKNNVITTVSPDVTLLVDPVQIEQVLINIIKNAVESTQGINSEGIIELSWLVQENIFTLTICDDGAGILNPDNLFVPFYTTKQRGSGIGLVLCRQILDAHQGQLTLTNRLDKKGCLAAISLPME